MTQPVLVVMTRWPASGRCKRRLAQTLGASPAARIQSRLIAHTLTVAQNVAAQHRLHLHVAVSGAGPRARQRWLASLPQARVIGQGHGGLGNRMRREVLRAKTVHPGSPVILIGTDLPDLEERDLAQAIEALKQAPVVLGPSQDGGYWLLGLDGSGPGAPRWPFHSMPWGTDRVCHVTRERARLHGVEPAELVARNDIDQLNDLTAWLQ